MARLNRRARLPSKRLAHLDALLALEPLRDHGAVVELDRPAIRADNHQHIDRCRARLIGARRTLAGQRMHIEIAGGAEAAADGAGSDVLAEQETFDLCLANIARDSLRHRAHH